MENYKILTINQSDLTQLSILNFQSYTLNFVQIMVSLFMVIMKTEPKDGVYVINRVWFID